MPSPTQQPRRLDILKKYEYSFLMKTSPPVAHQSLWQTSEAIALAFVSTASVLHWLLPATRVRWIPWALGIPVAAASLGIAILLIVAAKRELRRHGQGTAPGMPTTALVTSGPFRRSRNPMYLAMLLILSSLGLTALPILLPMLVAAPAVLHVLLIAPEERLLTQEFGPAFADYCAQVPRWVGLRSVATTKQPESTEAEPCPDETTSTKSHAKT